LYATSVRLGHTAVAELLARYGAERQDIVLDDEDQFVGRQPASSIARKSSASWRGIPRIPALVKGNIAAARQDRADVVAWLLDLGTPIEVEDAKKAAAAACRRVRTMRRMSPSCSSSAGPKWIPTSLNYSNTPLDFAVYHDTRA